MKIDPETEISKIIDVKRIKTIKLQLRIYRGLGIMYEHLLWTHQRSKAEGEYEHEKRNSSGVPSCDGKMYFLRC